MKTVKVTREGLKSTVGSLKGIVPMVPGDKEKDLTLAIDGLQCLLEIQEMIQKGCGITDVRKFLNVFPEKIAPQPDPDENSDQNDAVPQGSDVSGKPDSPGNQEAFPAGTKNKNHKGKQSALDFESAKEIIHTHPLYDSGSPCPHCTGKLYDHKNEDHFRTRIWFEASPILTATRHVFKDLRCNLCKQVFSVPATSELLADGFGEEERFGYSAISMIVIMKYFYAFPLYRMEKLQSHFAIHLPDATQWDQIVKFAEVGRILFDAFKSHAAGYRYFYGDDTTNTIREKDGELISGRTTGKISYRDGCHSSVVIGYDGDGHHILVVKTDIVYLGEWLDEILKHRDPELPKPLLMVDGSSQNLVTTTPVVVLNCNQHARKKFEECQKQFPDECGEVLAIYKKIFKIDRKTKDMSPADRLSYHQQHSEPLFNIMLDKVKGWKEAKIATEHSPFGKACDYVLDREKALKGFVEIEGAVLSNNLTESQIISIALLRNVCPTFQTVYSAEVASIIFSIGLTAILNDVDILDYFTCLLRYASLMKEVPEKFFPWEYKMTIEQLEGKATEPPPSG